MKKRLILIILLLLIIPISYFTIIPSSIGNDFSKLPLSDPSDDVYRYPGSIANGTAEIGDYHNEIDILSITFSGYNLTIEFAAPPQLMTNYSYSVLIDNNSNELQEYWITGAGNVFQLARTDLHLWDPISQQWILGSANLTYTVSSNNLTIENLGIAIPELPSTQIMVSTSYLGETPSYFYIDYAPLQDGSNGTNGAIPSFHLILTIFCLIPMIGLIYLFQKRY